MRSCSVLVPWNVGTNEWTYSWFAHDGSGRINSLQILACTVVWQDALSTNDGCE